MIRKRVIRQFCLILMGVCLAAPTVGCGAEQPVEDTPEIAAPQDSASGPQEETDQPEDQDHAEQDSMPEENISEADTSEEEPSGEELFEEDLYWQEMLAEFGNSRYDLTAALTEPALKDYWQHSGKPDS